MIKIGNSDIRGIKLGASDVQAFLGDQPLFKYRKAQYISSTTTGGQYIDLGCKLMENTDPIEISIKFNITGRGKDGPDTQGTLLASQPEVSPWPGFVLRYAGSDDTYIQLQVKFNFTGSWNFGGGKYQSMYLSYGGKYDQRCYDNTIYEFTETLDNMPSSQIHTMNCHLFCALDGNNQPFRFTKADLYYLKIKKGGVVIRDLVPVYNYEEGEAGLYDKQNDVFYKSQGDAPFEVTY